MSQQVLANNYSSDVEAKKYYLWDAEEDAAEIAAWENAIANMVTETDEPVESFFIEKQMRILVDALLSSWQPSPSENAPDEPRPFIAACNVGVFTDPRQPVIVPDMFLSLDVEQLAESNSKESHSYCYWVYNKPLDAVVEIISDKRGDELNNKMGRYGRMNVRYYVTFDPREIYGDPIIRVYERTVGANYKLREDWVLPEIDLSVGLWRGSYQGLNEPFLRWFDRFGNLILTGAELAESEREKAQIEREKAQIERDNTRAERERADAAENELAKLRAELEALRRGE